MIRRNVIPYFTLKIEAARPKHLYASIFYPQHTGSTLNKKKKKKGGRVGKRIINKQARTGG
jgi:hypothetical protein